jgi:integrase
MAEGFFPRSSPRDCSMNLNAKTIAGLTLPADKLDRIWFDERLPGHGYRMRRKRIGAPVRCTWIAQYGNRRVTHGKAGTLKPGEAFEASRRILARAALGEDPQGEKAAKRQAAVRTLRAVVESYLAVRASELRASSLRVTKLYLTGTYFRTLHTSPISAIDHPGIATCIRSIERNHSSATAAAARRAISTLFGWAIAEGLLGRNPVNPVIGTFKPNDPTPRDRVLSDAELVAIWLACDPDGDYGRIIRLLILLGSRSGELGGMAWSELDLDAGTWHLPKERSKNHRAHLIVLPKPALEIICAIPRRADRDQLFGGRVGRGFTAWPRSKAALDRRLDGRVKPWRGHDIRRSVATGMADLGIQPHIIEAVLNHYTGHRSGTAGIYNRSRYDREVTAALGRWATHVLALVDDRAENKVMLLQRA